MSKMVGGVALAVVLAFGSGASAAPMPEQLPVLTDSQSLVYIFRPRAIAWAARGANFLIDDVRVVVLGYNNSYRSPDEAPMPHRPIEQQEAASEFYASLGIDVSYFAAIWHTYKVGHLLMADLDRICMDQGLSMADVHLMGAVRLDATGQLRATDLAQTLHVSNAVLSTRVAKLERQGLVARAPRSDDRRAFGLSLTADGIEALDAAIAAVKRQAHFVKSYARLSQQDRADLSRIMGELHSELDREFVSAVRTGV